MIGPVRLTEIGFNRWHKNKLENNRRLAVSKMVGAAAMAEETRSRLGRGLAALMGDVGAESAVSDRGAQKTPRRVPIENIKPNPRNPRRTFADDDLAELSQSIKERGIIQPIVVRALKGEKDKYEIIAGERRWRASQKAGLHDVPIVLLDVGDAEALELAIIENVQRTDLNPLEEAAGYQSLASDYSHSQEDIASIVGKSRSHITNTLRLLKLPDSVKAFINEGKLSAGHARALVGQPNPEQLAQDIVSRGLNVRQAEALRQDNAKDAPKKSKAKARKDADTAAVEKRLSDLLGLAVEIKHGTRGGHLQIKYKTLEQLEDVIKRLEGGG
jgi:ParB family chromosome partitioning protein